MRKTRAFVVDWGEPVPEGQEPAPGQNRDWGKKFLLTEMGAVPAERWANRAILALAPRLSQEVPEDVLEELKANPTMPPMGRIFRLLGGISWPELEPLVDELMGCAQVLSDRPGIPPRALNLGGVEDLEEMETVQRLRAEVMDLHVGFTMPASILNLLAAVARVEISPDALTSQTP